MGSTNLESNKLEMYEFGPFEEDDGFKIGYLIGQKFSKLIQSRLSTDLILQNQLLPFAQLPNSKSLIHTLSEINKNKFPNYWNELRGIAQGSGVPFLNAFTLNSVPPCEEEIVGGAIGRNFVSRDLLEASSIEDALARIRSSEASVGHSYNLIDTRTRRILNVETASRNRISVREIGETPFFHANMYLHLQVKQAQDENSLSRQRRASSLAKESKSDVLALLGDMNNEKYPIYMKGPLLYTLCTAVIDLDEKILTIIEGNPKEKQESFVFSLS